MTWAQRLERVFGVDIQTCAACGGAVRIIACIEDPQVMSYCQIWCSGPESSGGLV